MELRRFLTAGEVDDGKSTLIGRLFHDAGLIREDQLSQIKDNLAHFTDGLKEERERGITMDVAYRFFETTNRKYIVADGPGHLPYIRHMVTAASLSDAAIILVDATRGVSLQSRRHAFIAQWLGVPSLMFVINKMDAIGFSQSTYNQILSDLEDFKGAQFIPASALNGDNIVSTSKNMNWYQGPTLMQWLETIPARLQLEKDKTRFPVQLNLSGDALGTLVAGHLKVGQKVFCGSEEMEVESILKHPNRVDKIEAGEPARLKLSKSVTRGSLITSEPMKGSNAWSAQWLLFSEPTKQTLVQAYTWRGTLTKLSASGHFDWEKQAWLSSQGLPFPRLEKGEIHLSDTLINDAYNASTGLGFMILIDEETKNTIGAVLLEKAL